MPRSSTDPAVACCHAGTEASVCRTINHDLVLQLVPGCCQLKHATLVPPVVDIKDIWTEAEEGYQLNYVVRHEGCAIVSQVHALICLRFVPYTHAECFMQGMNSACHSQ